MSRVMLTRSCWRGASSTLAKPFSCSGGSGTPEGEGSDRYSSGTAQPLRLPVFLTLTLTVADG